MSYIANLGLIYLENVRYYSNFIFNCITLLF